MPEVDGSYISWVIGQRKGFTLIAHFRAALGRRWYWDPGLLKPSGWGSS